MLLQKTETFMPFDEHEEFITGVLVGRWWAVMEIEDHLRSSCEKGECGDLPTDQEIEAPQGATVPFSSKQEVPVPSRILKGTVVPNGSQQVVPVSSRTPKGPTVPEESQWEVPVLSRNLQVSTVPDGSQQEAPVPARPPLR